jgi:hypothetical protein
MGGIVMFLNRDFARQSLELHLFFGRMQNNERAFIFSGIRVYP